MNWTDNVTISFLETKNWDDLEAFKNSPNSSMLLTITDQTMYDRYEKDDTVRVKVTGEIPEEADCLIYNKLDDTLSLRHVIDKGSTYIVSQTFPESEKEYSKDDIEILGYTTSIMRV